MTRTSSPFAGFFSTPFADAAVVKPAFSHVPLQVRDDLCCLAGAHSITDVQTASGGISASAAYIVTFDTGLRLFVKGSHPHDQSHGAANLRGECMAYRAIDLLADIAPQFCGMVSLDAGDDNGWWLGAWQAVDVDRTTPYDAAQLLAVLRSVAQHEVKPSRGLAVASAHPYLSQFMTDTYKWKRVCSDKTRSDQFSACFVDADTAADWLWTQSKVLLPLQAEAATHGWQLGLMHGDARCDNFIYARAAAQEARWYLVDWANAADGPLAFDRVMLAASLVAEGVLRPDAAYAIACEGVASSDIRLMAVMQAGYFADQLYRAPVPSMPRLRSLQKAMFWGVAQLLAADGVIAPPPAFKVA